MPAPGLHASASSWLGGSSAIEGDRKQVTVLSADINGSIDLLADRDPEDARGVALEDHAVFEHVERFQ